MYILNKVMKVESETFCEPFIQKIIQNKISSMMMSNDAYNQGGWLIL